MPDAVVEIRSLAPGGDAIGRQIGGEHDGRVVFVAFAAPGERVTVRIRKEKARAAWGDLVAIEKRSDDRIEPRCPLHGRCGGCQWQHVPRDAQLVAKRAIVERALGIPTEVRAVGPAFGYRERARLTVGAGGSVGFHGRRSRDVVDVVACPLLGPDLAAALPAVRSAAAALPAGTDVHLQAGAGGVAVAPPIRGFPREVDVGEAGSPPLVVTAGAFAQVGRPANQALCAAVLDAVGASPGRVVELHAGSGNFTRHLVKRASGVEASDADADAVDRGRRNVPAAAWSTLPPRPAATGADPDTVVLDPPREGATAAHLAVAARARRRVVYVSCDPQTLARDARRLGAAGFALRGAVALDLMPQTFHIEVVAVFEPTV